MDSYVSHTLSVAYTVESAQAALQLGPVQYVCNVCGRTHTSEEPPPRNCILARIRQAGKSSWAGSALPALAKAVGLLAAELGYAGSCAMARMQQDAYLATQDLVGVVYPAARIVALLSSNLSLHVTLSNLKGASETNWLGVSGRRGSSWALMVQPDSAHREILRAAGLHLRRVQWPPTHVADACGGKVRQAYDDFLTAIERFAAVHLGLD